MKYLIYTFWLGENNIPKNYPNEIKIILGPTKDDHKFLMDNYKFYKDSFLNKKYAFCSDVWRFFKIYKNGGIYLDNNIQFGANWKSFFESINNNQINFIMENQKIYWSGFMFFPEKKDIRIKKILDFYKNYSFKENEVVTSCIIMTLLFWNETNITKHKIYVLDPKNNCLIKKTGGSWLNISLDQHQNIWNSIFNSFDKMKFYQKIYWNLLLKHHFLFILLNNFIKILPIKNIKQKCNKNINLIKTFKLIK